MTMSTQVFYWLVTIELLVIIALLFPRRPRR
jgi:hypothetical protein